MASKKKPAKKPKVDEIIDADVQEIAPVDDIDQVEEIVALEGAVDDAAQSPTENDTVDMADETIDEIDEEIAPQAEQIIVKKGGVAPLVLGGVIAAVIGFGAARVVPQGWPFPGATNDATEVADQIAKQADMIATLQATVQELSKGPDLSGVTNNIAVLRGDIDGAGKTIADMGDQMAALTAQVIDLEKRPITSGASQAAVAAYEAELKAAQDAMAAQREEIEQKAATAEMSAQEAMKRAAMSQIQIALDTGAGFGGAVDSLTKIGVKIPADLSQAAADGIISMADLNAQFPIAARDALAKARKESGSGGGIAGFFKTQLGARSLEPKEGTDADAVLSRAEGALRDGRLGDAIAELNQLSEGARAEMGTWLSNASARTMAVKSVEALGQQMNLN